MRAAALALGLLMIGTASNGVLAEPDPARGQQVFGRSCVACHSLEPDKNMTGPSLAGLWGRKAGGLASFNRYSPAIKSAEVVWDDQTLDRWLTDPKRFIPGNLMLFPGVQDEQARADLMTFLKQAAQPGAQSAQGTPGMEGMMGMGAAVPDLKSVAASSKVSEIKYCGDTYSVTTADGQTVQFWERNLRFKTDTSPDGPPKGSPAIVGAGMAGDRASVIFAAPEEFGQFIKRRC